MKKIIALLILSIFVSCTKIDDPIPAKSTTDLVASPNFNWKTTKEITLQIVGMKEINPIVKNTLSVSSTSGGFVYYKDMLYMSNDYTLKFDVPSTETSITVCYGSKSTKIDLHSNEIIYDYITQ